MTADPKTTLKSILPGPLGTNLPSQEGGPGSTTALDSPLPESDEGRYTGIELWLHRITVLLFVFLCAGVGVLLVILPWRPEWTDNHLLLASPALRTFVSHGFVRGLCSGLGLVDIWIGFGEAIRYQEEKTPK